jgi:nucleoside-diphosphate-sugar epimerase
MASAARGSDGCRVLVTGGAGFIGASFVHRFLEQFPGSHVVVLDALTVRGPAREPRRRARAVADVRARRHS